MTKALNDTPSIQEQYRTSGNLDARIRLHQLFSTNPYGWTRWVFDQLAAPAQAQVLEIGCGPATLWVENRERILSGWQITLTDQSPGMMQQAQANLATTSHEFHFQQAVAQASLSTTLLSILSSPTTCSTMYQTGPAPWPKFGAC